jgi:hypothetical protein
MTEAREDRKDVTLAQGVQEKRLWSVSRAR